MLILLIYISKCKGFTDIKMNNIIKNTYYVDENTVMIFPKKIWTYWHDKNIGPVIGKCIDNWKKFNPDFEIIVLNQENYTDYIKNVDINKYPAIRFHQRASDFLRIHALNQHGGIWLDASTILTKNLGWIINKFNEGKYEFIGYRIVSKETKPEYPVIENWCMAAPSGSRFIKLWLKEFLRLNLFITDTDYLADIVNRSVDIQKISQFGYLAMHYAAQYVLQKQMTIEEINTKLYLLKAEHGPFKYLHLNGWEQKKSIEALCANKDLQTDIIKFRKHEREYIEANENANCVFNLS